MPSFERYKFAIFLLKDTSITIKQLVNKNINDFEIANKPWLTSNEIEFYDWSSHCIYLKKDKNYFFPNFPSLFQASWANRPFITIANGDKCYAGYFLSANSSDIRPYPDIFDIDILFYPPDIIHIEWPYPFANDIRDHNRVRSSLLESHLLHEGLGITIDSLWISNGDTATVRYKITIINKDADNLYVLDPEKMGTELFRAFTNGPIFYNIDSKILYESIYKRVTIPSPPNSYNPEWFMKVESSKSMTKMITLKGYPHLPMGNYYCRMGFRNPYSIQRKDRTLADGRYWIGFRSSELIGFNLDSGAITSRLRPISRTEQANFLELIHRN